MTSTPDKPTFQTPWEKTRDARLAAKAAKPAEPEPAQELFAAEDIIPWRAEWKNMPEYDVQDLAPQFQIIINFACEQDVEDFGELIGQKVSGATRKAGSCNSSSSGKQTRSYWFPEQEIGRMVNKRYIQGKA